MVRSFKQEQEEIYTAWVLQAVRELLDTDNEGCEFSLPFYRGIKKVRGLMEDLDEVLGND